MSNEDTHFLQPKITGYRQLDTSETALMNEAKSLAEAVGAFAEKLRTEHPPADGIHPTGWKTIWDGKPNIDKRWVAIGVTNLQQGFMALTRSIAKPTTF